MSSITNTWTVTNIPFKTYLIRSLDHELLSDLFLSIQNSITLFNQSLNSNLNLNLTLIYVLILSLNEFNDVVIS
jgi:hypothetical protein